MKKYTLIAITIIALSMMIIGSAQAAITLNHTVDFWFANATTGEAMSSIALDQNANFDLAIWCKSNAAFTAKSAELYVSFGSTILNLNAPAGFVSTATFATANSNAVDAAGADIVWSDVSGKQMSGGMKLGVLNLQNLVASGSSDVISIVTHPNATGASTLNKSSWLYGGTSLIGYLNETANTVFTVNSNAVPDPIVPEPATLVGLLAFAPALIAVAKRKK